MSTEHSAPEGAKADLATDEWPWIAIPMFTPSGTAYVMATEKSEFATETEESLWADLQNAREQQTKAEAEVAMVRADNAELMMDRRADNLRIEALVVVLRPLLDHYLNCYGGNKDRLALDAEAALDPD